MQPKAPDEQNNHDLQFVVTLVLVAMVLFHIGAAYRGVGVGREQHLGTAVEYARGKIDLLRPIIIGANVNGAPTPLEVPIWQAATAVLMKAFGVWYGWGNVVSLIFHFSTVWPIFQFTKRLFSARVGWWALILFLIQPLTFVWGGSAGADGMAASFAIWFAYFAYRMMQSTHLGWWVASLIAGCLSSTTKAPFFFVGGLAAFFWLLKEHRSSPRAWLQLSSVGILSVAAFLLWNHHANNCYKEAELPNFDLRIGDGSKTLAWWFGDLSSRLDLKSWIRGAWRLAIALTGSLGLLALPLIGWFLNGAALLRLWIYAGIVALIVFTNLILIHWHYYFIFSAPMALLAARGAAELEGALRHVLDLKTPFRIAIYLAVAAGGLVQGFQAMHLNLMMDRYPAETAGIINQQTTPGDKLVVWGGEWTTPLLRVTRQGYNIFDWQVINDPSKLARLKELGYNRLVLINNSPLLVAINTASGMGGFKQKDLLAEVPPGVRDWKVRYSSTSLVILDIPK